MVSASSDKGRGGEGHAHSDVIDHMAKPPGYDAEVRFVGCKTKRKRNWEPEKVQAPMLLHFTRSH